MSYHFTQERKYLPKYCPPFYCTEWMTNVLVGIRLCLNIKHWMIFRVGSAPWRYPLCLADRETETQRGKGVCWNCTSRSQKSSNLRGVPPRRDTQHCSQGWGVGKCQKGLNWMNCSHFSIHYVSMGHMLRAHLLLLPWELTQRQSQNGCFNAKHIRRPEGWRRCCLGLPGYTWLGRLCSRPWERLIQVLTMPGPKGSQAKGWTIPGPGPSWSPTLPSRASGVGEVDLLSQCHGGAPKSYRGCDVRLLRWGCHAKTCF